MTLLLVIFAVGLGFTAYSKIKKRMLNRVAVGRRVVLRYAGRNEPMKNEWPRTGIIKGTVKIGGKSDNFLVILDEPIEFGNAVISRVIVRERILGNYIGSDEETHVHLLLPKKEPVTENNLWDAFEYGAWLTLRLE